MNPDTPPQVAVTPTNPALPDTPPVQNPPVNESSNGLATTAFVLSLLGILIFIAGIIGFVMGIVAFKRSKTMNGKGRGMAIASIIIGFITGILGFLLLAIFLAIPALQKNSWSNSNLSNFKSAYSNISTDYTNLSSDFSTISNTPAANFQSSSLDPALLNKTQTDCSKLQTDSSTLKSLPAYPVSSTNTLLQKAASTLSQSASDCLTGLSQSSVNQLNQSASELVQGSKDLASVNASIQSNK